MDSPAVIHTIKLKPREREALKPTELIQVTGHQTLSLYARRAITILWHNAHQQGVEPGKDYSIEIDNLKTDRHKGYDAVEDAIVSLMRTILTVKLPNGATRRVQFLGGNDLDDPKRHAGVLTYSFDKRLIQILQDSTVWGKINLPVLMAFMSKYSVSLYENISQMVNLEWKQFHDYSIAEFRELMGVQDGQYKTFGEFNKHVLKPAVMEINALASFTVAVLPVKEGRRVARIRVGWMHKDPDELREAMKEVESTKVGRKARISGNVELVAQPTQSIGRLMRTDRLARPGTRVPRAS
jgi:Initiator Rep protein, WH2/Initiator Replication protein, WH1